MAAGEPSRICVSCAERQGGGQEDLWEVSEDGAVPGGAQPCGVLTPQLCPSWVFCPCHLVQPHGDRVWSQGHRDGHSPVLVQDYEQQGCSDRLT